MADESKTRPYRSDAYAARSASAQGAGRTSGGDPLAELARLIGQDDLFEQTRPNSSRPLPRSNPRYSDPTGPAAETPPRYADNGAAETPSWQRASQSIEDELRGTYGGREDARDTRGAPIDSEDPRAYARAARPENVRAARYAQRQYEDYEQPAQPPAAAVHPRDAQPAAYARQQPYAEPQATTAADPDYAQDVVADPYTNEQFEQDAHYGDEAYEQPPVVERRRGGLITIAAVIGVALIGTAAAFGYRSWTGNGSHGQPPVINALGGPNKITPSPANDGDQANKAIYDRAEKAQGERVVSREEQPLDVKQNTASNQNGGSASAGGTSEPRKVRTFAIRPDGSIITDASGAPVSSGARVAAASPPPAQAQPQAATPSPRVVPTRAVPAPAPAAAPTRTASLPPAQQAVPAGSYVVQLVSNKSEAEAQSAFRGLQAKYPSVLGNRQPLIRRVDLGDKGIYYRAQVGPFAAADEANDFCGNLKSAGGQCIVQKN